MITIQLISSKYKRDGFIICEQVMDVCFNNDALPELISSSHSFITSLNKELFKLHSSGIPVYKTTIAILYNLKYILIFKISQRHLHFWIWIFL